MVVVLNMFSKSIRPHVYNIIFYLMISAALWFWVPNPRGHYDIDSYGYDDIARHFAHTYDLTDPHNPTSAPIQPIGYHFVLGLLYWLFNNSLDAVIFVQIILMCIIMALLFSIARRWFTITVARCVGLFMVTNIGLWIYPQLLLAESVLLFIMVCFVERYMRFLSHHMNAHMLQASFILGISMLIKPIALLLMGPLALIVWLQDMPKGKKMKATVLLVVGFSAPILIYMTRNYMKYDHFAFAPMAQLNMFQCLLAKVMSIVEQQEEQHIIETKLRFHAGNSLDANGWQQASDYFYTYLYTYPHIFAYVWMLNVIKTWCGLYATQCKKMIEPTQPRIHSFFNCRGSLLTRCYAYIAEGTTSTLMVIIAWFEVWYTMIRLICAMIGMHVLWRNRQYSLLLLFTSIMISFSILTGIDGCCRYRISYEPALLLLAAVGLAYVYELLMKKNQEYGYGFSW